MSEKKKKKRKDRNELNGKTNPTEADAGMKMVKVRHLPGSDSSTPIIGTS